MAKFEVSYKVGTEYRDVEVDGQRVDLTAEWLTIRAGNAPDQMVIFAAPSASIRRLIRTDYPAESMARFRVEYKYATGIKIDHVPGRAVQVTSNWLTISNGSESDTFSTVFAMPASYVVSVHQNAN